LQLADLVVPSPNPEVTSRRATAADRDLLIAWRTAYGVEVLGAGDDEPTRKNVAQFLDAQLATGNVWVATVNGQPVSLSAFNAALSDIVQLGGIYTPPELRGRGYARRAIAAQLLEARAQGTERSVLFTSHPHAARAYEALGYRWLQDFAVVLLDSAG
jgi:predicted GNAT family acetyltransferase